MVWMDEHYYKAKNAKELKSVSKRLGAILKVAKAEINSFKIVKKKAVGVPHAAKLFRELSQGAFSAKQSPYLGANSGHFQRPAEVKKALERGKNSKRSGGASGAKSSSAETASAEKKQRRGPLYSTVSMSVEPRGVDANALAERRVFFQPAPMQQKTAEITSSKGEAFSEQSGKLPGHGHKGVVNCEGMLTLESSREMYKWGVLKIAPGFCV